MKSFKMTTLLSTLLLALPLAAFAGDDEHGPGGHHGDRMERMAEHLDLSEEQRERMEAIHETNYPRMEELHEQMQEKKEAIREAAIAGDEGAAQAAAAELGDLAAEAALLRANTMATVHDLLNEEQRERFEEMHERMGQGRGHHGRGRGHHGEDEDMRGRGNR